MSDYKNWDTLIECFENTQDFKGCKTDKNYYVSLIGWLQRNHLPPLKKNEKLQVGGLIINVNCRTVYVDENQRHFLPKRVFDVLILLASNPDKVFTRQDILNKVWEKGVYVTEKTVDVHINRIRKILGSQIILTHVGVGYRININDEAPLTKLRTKRNVIKHY